MGSVQYFVSNNSSDILDPTNYSFIVFLCMLPSLLRPLLGLRSISESPLSLYLFEYCQMLCVHICFFSIPTQMVHRYLLQNHNLCCSSCNACSTGMGPANFTGYRIIKLNCWQYPAINTNYSCSNCTISN